MKKFFYCLMIAVLSIGFTACQDDDQPYEMISYSSLPANAQSFVMTYFGGMEVSEVQSDGDDYVVFFDNGIEIVFDDDGSWEDVTATYGNTIPTTFLPLAIINYVNYNYPSALGINGVSYDEGDMEYTVQLTSGTIIYFDQFGDVIGTGW